MYSHLVQNKNHDRCNLLLHYIQKDYKMILYILIHIRIYLDLYNFHGPNTILQEDN